MYGIYKTSRFKKDFKNIKFDKSVLESLQEIFECFIDGKKLPLKYKEHSLHGEFKDCCECHVRPNILLIYTKNNTLKRFDLLRIGTHSNLFE